MPKENFENLASEEIYIIPNSLPQEWSDFSVLVSDFEKLFPLFQRIKKCIHSGQEINSSDMEKLILLTKYPLHHLHLSAYRVELRPS